MGMKDRNHLFFIVSHLLLNMELFTRIHEIANGRRFNIRHGIYPAHLPSLSGQNTARFVRKGRPTMVKYLLEEILRDDQFSHVSLWKGAVPLVIIGKLRDRRADTAYRA